MTPKVSKFVIKITDLNRALQVLTSVAGVERSGVSSSHLGLLLGHVRCWEVTEGRVLGSWEQLVVGSLPWGSGLAKNFLKVVLINHGTGVVSLCSHISL